MSHLQQGKAFVISADISTLQGHRPVFQTLRSIFSGADLSGQHRQCSAGIVQGIDPHQSQLEEFPAQHRAVGPEPETGPAQALGQEPVDLLAQEPLHILPVRWMHKPAAEHIPNLIQGIQLLQRGQLRVRIIHHMEQLPIHVQLHKKPVDVMDQGKIFSANPFYGIFASQLLRQRQLCSHGLLGRLLSIGIFQSQSLKLMGHMLEAVQQLGREHAAFSPEDHIHRLCKGIGILIHPLGGQGIIDICQAHHLGTDGNGFSLQPFGVTAAIPALVVIVADVVGIKQILPVRHALQSFQNPAAGEGMGLHGFPFFLRQRARFHEDSVGNGNFTDVMEGGGTADDVDVLLIQPVFRTASCHLLQQQPGEMPDPADMLSRFHAAVLNDGGQRIHHGIGGMTQNLLLLFHHGFQMLLVQMQIDDILHPVEHGIGIVSQRNHICRTLAEGPIQNGCGIRLGQNDHRNLTQKGLVVLTFYQPDIGRLPVADVQQNRCDAAEILAQQLSQLPDIPGFQKVEGIGKNLPQLLPVFPDTAADQKRIVLYHNGFLLQNYIFSPLYNGRLPLSSDFCTEKRGFRTYSGRRKIILQNKKL